MICSEIRKRRPGWQAWAAIAIAATAVVACERSRGDRRAGSDDDALYQERERPLTRAAERARRLLEESLWDQFDLSPEQAAAIAAATALPAGTDPPRMIALCVGLHGSTRVAIREDERTILINAYAGLNHYDIAKERKRAASIDVRESDGTEWFDGLWLALCAADAAVSAAESLELKLKRRNPLFPKTLSVRAISSRGQLLGREFDGGLIFNDAEGWHNSPAYALRSTLTGSVSLVHLLPEWRWLPTGTDPFRVEAVIQELLERVDPARSADTTFDSGSQLGVQVAALAGTAHVGRDASVGRALRVALARTRALAVREDGRLDTADEMHDECLVALAVRADAASFGGGERLELLRQLRSPLIRRGAEALLGGGDVVDDRGR